MAKKRVKPKKTSRKTSKKIKTSPGKKIKTMKSKRTAKTIKTPKKNNYHIFKDPLFLTAAGLLIILALLLYGVNFPLKKSGFAAKYDLSACFDTDGKGDFGETGYVEIEGQIYQDYCDGNKAIDYYCELGEVKKIGRYCQKSCDNGVCLFE